MGKVAWAAEKKVGGKFETADPPLHVVVHGGSTGDYFLYFLLSLIIPLGLYLASKYRETNPHKRISCLVGVCTGVAVCVLGIIAAAFAVVFVLILRV